MKKNPAGTNPSIGSESSHPQPATPSWNAGESNGRHRLTAPQVLAIYASQGETITALAERYGVTHQTISLIRRGKRWARLTQRPAGESAA